MKILISIALAVLTVSAHADDASEKKIAALEDRVAKLEKIVASLTSSPEAITQAKAKNKYGIPDDPFNVIESKAKQAWPDDFSMQKFTIEKEVKAYKELHDN